MQEATFYVLLHDDPSETFVVGPFPDRSEAEKYRNEMVPMLKKCTHRWRIVAGAYGPHQIVATVVVKYVPETRDHLN